MAQRPIKLFPDEILASPTLPIRDFGTSLEELVRDLFGTLYRSPGVGLAAPQIGILKSVAVIDISKRPPKKGIKTSNHGPIVLINPTLISGKGVQIPREGCLSVPEFLANIKRFEEVLVECQNLNGKKVFITGMGFEALALQHEIDHLDGKLFLDRVTNIKTDIFRRKVFS